MKEVKCSYVMSDLNLKNTEAIFTMWWFKLSETTTTLKCMQWVLLVIDAITA